MNHQLFLDMEMKFRGVFGVGRGGLGGVLNADSLQTGMAYTGFVSALAPLYKEALVNDDKEFQNRINDAIEKHYDLMTANYKSPEYITLSQSALEAFKELRK